MENSKQIPRVRSHGETSSVRTEHNDQSQIETTRPDPERDIEKFYYTGIIHELSININTVVPSLTKFCRVGTAHQRLRVNRRFMVGDAHPTGPPTELCQEICDTEIRITLLQKILYILSILVGIVFYRDAQDRQNK